MTDASKRDVFGAAPGGVHCEKRRAAYAIILDQAGRVGVVRERGHWFLPGGGSLAGEAAEETVLREIQEECGYQARILGNVGEAVQYFANADTTRWFEMVAVFFLAELDAMSLDSTEYELQWLDPGELRKGFLHASHAWAVSRACDAVGRCD